jgi:hypothetical protein
LNDPALERSADVACQVVLLDPLLLDMSLDSAKHPLRQIEVWAIGRKEEALVRRRLKGKLDTIVFVCGAIVHDDHARRIELGEELCREEMREVDAFVRAHLDLCCNETLLVDCYKQRVVGAPLCFDSLDRTITAWCTAILAAKMKVEAGFVHEDEAVHASILVVYLGCPLFPTRDALRAVVIDRLGVHELHGISKVLVYIVGDGASADRWVELEMIIELLLEIANE